MRILLHACCGPCVVFPALLLGAEGHHVVVFFYNPNIFPADEKDRRKAALDAIAGKHGWTVWQDDDEYESFVARISDPERPARCRICYHIRLEKTARIARSERFDAFSTSLLVSPYQNHRAVREIGEQVGAEAGIPFVYRDFRVGYLRGRNVARGSHVYMQKYCGCLWSREEASRNSAT